MTLNRIDRLTGALNLNRISPVAIFFGGSMLIILVAILADVSFDTLVIIICLEIVVRDIISSMRKDLKDQTPGWFFQLLAHLAIILILTSIFTDLRWLVLAGFGLTSGITILAMWCRRQSILDREDKIKVTTSQIENHGDALVKQMTDISELNTLAFAEQKRDTFISELQDFLKEASENVRSAPSDEIYQMKMRFLMDSKFNEFEKKLCDIRKLVEHKKSILKNVNICSKDLEVEYQKIVQSIPNTSSEDLLDVDEFFKEADLLKNELDNSYQGYCNKMDGIKSKVEESDQENEDAKLLLDATGISNDFMKEVTKIKVMLEQLKLKYAVTPGGQLAREMKKDAKPIKVINGKNVLKLPIKLINQNVLHNFRHYTIGEAPAMLKPSKVVMMVGMTGAGKSLMINNIVNYVYGVSFRDPFRFKLILEDEELEERGSSGDESISQADSMTRMVSSYTLHYQEGFRVPFSLILIDTPGFGDTRGVSYDEKIVKSLKEFFNDNDHPITEVSCIGLVIQASQARLTAEQMYVFNSVLNIFGNDVTENICLLFTFADAQPPPALETVKKEGIPFSDNGIFKFNNSAVFAGDDDESNAYSWKFGFESLEKFFRHISVTEPASLSLTKEVLKERETLHIILDSLQPMINDGFETLQSIEQMTRSVMQLKGTMLANKNFKVKKIVHPQETKIVNHNITNCKSCMMTCHDPCYIEGDDKKGCASMRDGHCVKCSGKCPWEMHSNGDRIYIYTRLETEETIEEMMEKYKIALNDKNAKIQLLKKLLQDYNEQKNTVFLNIIEASEAAQRLEEIALGKSLLSSVGYIDRLIDSERQSKRPNKDHRIRQLQFFKERAEMLNNAMENPEMLTEKMTQYEETVREEIIKLELNELDENYFQSTKNQYKLKTRTRTRSFQPKRWIPGNIGQGFANIARGFTKTFF